MPPRKVMLSLPRPTVRIIIIKTPAIRSPGKCSCPWPRRSRRGLIEGRMHRSACTHCLNLPVTYPEGVRANGAYCGLARHAKRCATLRIAILFALSGRRCMYE